MRVAGILLTLFAYLNASGQSTASAKAGNLSIRLTYAYLGSFEHSSFDLKSQTEPTVGLYLNGLAKTKFLKRLAVGLEFPLKTKILITTDTYETFDGITGEATNDYRLWDPKINIFYFFNNPNPIDPNKTMYAGFSCITYVQNPEKSVQTRLADNSVFKEYRERNVGLGCKIMAGGRLAFQNWTLDLEASYGTYFRFQRDSFKFNYFGNATPFPKYSSAGFFTIGIGVSKML